MLSFIIRRVLLAIPVLIGIMIVVFVLVRAIPGDPCTSLLGERATEEACDVFNEANGLNEPVWVQLGIYMGNVVTFDLGESIRFSRPVNQLLIERLPLTTELAMSALALAIFVGIPMGVVPQAQHHRRHGHHGVSQCGGVYASFLAWLDARVCLCVDLEGHGVCATPVRTTQCRPIVYAVL